MTNTQSTTAGGALRGVIAAMATPFGADQAPDLAETVRHGRRLLDAGCDGLAPIGSVGEGASLALEERIAILEALAAALPGERLVPETGCCALPDTVRLTRRAVDLGMAGAMLVAPYFYKGVSDEGLLDYFSRVIDGVGRDRLRLYLFDFASVTGVPLTVGRIDRLRQRFPGVLAGVKGGGGDGDAMLRMIRDLDGVAVYTGWERLLLANLKAGGGGGWSATTNLNARVAAEVHRCWREGRTADAEAAQQRLAALADAVTSRGAYAALKAVLAEWTGHETWRLLRPPLTALGEDEIRALLDELALNGLEGIEA